MKRVLVTGATGFIGSHVLDALCGDGWEVHAVTSGGGAGGVRRDGVTWHDCDLLDESATKSVVESVRASHLMHLAWYVEPGKLIGSPANFDWVSASMSLLRHFHAAGGRRLVCSGSCYEYDWRYGYCSEELTPTAPDTVYGACKDALRQMIEAYCRENDLGFGWGRVFFLYGPHENPKRLVSSVVLSLLRGDEAKSSHGKQIRDYGHVADIADGLVALLGADYNGALNIATGEATCIRDIVCGIGDILGARDLVKIGALPARANDLPMVVADVSQASSVLSWKPRYDLLTGLEHTVDWWRRNQ